MRFWDSSAIVPLLVDESESGSVSALLAEDGELTVWWGTRVECASAVRRREREGSLSAAEVGTALGLLDDLTVVAHELTPSEQVRASAERSLAVHDLAAADALQLAAALTWRGPVGPRAELVCLDQRLRAAATREGFALLPA